MNARRSALLAVVWVLGLGVGSAGGQSRAPTDSAPSWARGWFADHGSEPPVLDLSARRGPEVAVIDDLAFHYGAVVFDHGLHVRMSDILGECSNCHHETEPGEVITACRECHPLSRDSGDLRRPSLKGAFHRQCLSCHKDWSHANSCGFCHEDAGAPPVALDLVGAGERVGAALTHISPQVSYTYVTTREGAPVVTFHHDDHVAVFGLECADCHRDDSCTRCHGAGSARQMVDREQSCYPCHSPSTCVTCHDPIEKARFDHRAAAGWDLGTGHEGVQCIACHGGTTGAAVAEPTAVRCRACHERAHGGGLEEELVPLVPLFGSHARFECTCCHNGPDATLGASCTDCHEDKCYPDDVPGLASNPVW